MKSIRQIDIHLTKKGNVRLIDVVQYDTGIHLVFTVKDFDIPSGATAKLYVQKPSGKFVFQEDGITIVDNTILIDLENQAITEHGKVPYQVSITNGSDMITTFTGLMMVEKSLKDSNATESKTVIRAFDEVVSDHVAEFQAKAEQIVQACIATIPEDYTAMEAKVNELANAIKGNLSGAVVVADDVSPVEHSPVVRVHGKNLISYPHNHTTKTENGLTFTDNGDGSVTVVGTATTATYYDLCKFTSRLFSGDHRYFNAMNNRVTFEGYTIKDCSVQQTQSGNSFCHLVFTKGQTIDKTYYPQVEIGTAATEYTPYIDPSTVTVRRCGKNLLPNAATNESYSGITITVNEDKTLAVNGTATAPVFYAPYEFTFKAGIEYILSGCPAGGSADTYFVYINNLGGARDYGEGVSVLLDEDFTSAVGFCVRNGTAINNLTFKPMVRLAAIKDTRYEKHIATIHIPAADGTVSGVTSLSPNMTILTDTEGVIVECEYNRDTSKVIDKLINAITALGGTV